MDKSWTRDVSKFEITIEDVVIITEFFYPTMTLSDFLSKVGGTVGLWLGMGAVQLYIYCNNFLFMFLKK